MGPVPFALALTVILACLAAFQFALILGTPLGSFAWGGQNRVLPGRLRVGSAVSIVIYSLIVALAWDRVGAITLFPSSFSAVAMWVLVGYFALGIVLNAISRSKPERFTMVPVSIILAVLSLFIAMGYGEFALAI